MHDYDGDDDEGNNNNNNSDSNNMNSNIWRKKKTVAFWIMFTRKWTVMLQTKTIIKLSEYGREKTAKRLPLNNFIQRKFRIPSHNFFFFLINLTILSAGELNVKDWIWLIPSRVMTFHSPGKISECCIHNQTLEGKPLMQPGLWSIY